MMVPAVVKDKDSLRQCIYCTQDLTRKRWVSEHIDSIHYKVTDCSCGKRNSIKITDPFFSSGHDDWDGKGWISMKELTKMKRKSLENKI